MCGRLKSGFWVGLRGKWGVVALWCRFGVAPRQLLACWVVFVPSQGWFEQVTAAFQMMAMLRFSV